MKARFIDKWYGTGYDRDMVYLEYEYRGEKYIVMENRAKGNEPLAWQHKNEQARIDTLLSLDDKNATKKCNPIDFNEIYNMLGWD